MNIGFIGNNWCDTLKTFKQFVNDNKDEIDSYLLPTGTASMKDGSKITCISKYNNKTTSITYDYIIWSGSNEIALSTILRNNDINVSETVPDELKLLSYVLE